MENKTITVGREHKRDVEDHRIGERLLHSVADAMVVPAELCLKKVKYYVVRASPVNTRLLAYLIHDL